MKALPNLERFNINIKGVEILLEIDYATATVSILDSDGTPKLYRFTNRTRDYLGGWIQVLRALEETVIWADKRLKKELEKRKDMSKQEQFKTIMDISELEGK